jgi:hypothetical protein
MQHLSDQHLILQPIDRRWRAPQPQRNVPSFARLAWPPTAGGLVNRLLVTLSQQRAGPVGLPWIAR